MSGSIELNGVSKEFGETTAVDDISLSVEGGTFLTLLGPSGCGKTTILRLLSGHEEPTKGEVYLGGSNQSSIPVNDRPTNMVFQNYALFPNKNVRENVAFGLKMSGVSKDKRREEASEMLKTVKLGDYGDREVENLSGGQQQRVALARALINEPTILLLDEPLGALDLKLRKEMQIELKDIQKEFEITFIHVTHDQEEALTISDKIAVINNGWIEQIGTPDEIYNNPSTRFVADFIGDTNLIEGVYDKKDGAVDCGEFSIAVDSQNGMGEEENVALSIRPENVNINETTTTGTELIGIIDDVVYQGNITKIDVGVNGDTITAEMHMNKQNTIPSKGEKVTLSWKTADSTVVKAGPKNNL